MVITQRKETRWNGQTVEPALTQGHAQACALRPAPLAPPNWKWCTKIDPDGPIGTLKLVLMGPLVFPDWNCKSKVIWRTSQMNIWSILAGQMMILKDCTNALLNSVCLSVCDCTLPCLLSLPPLVPHPTQPPHTSLPSPPHRPKPTVFLYSVKMTSTNQLVTCMNVLGYCHYFVIIVQYATE